VLHKQVINSFTHQYGTCNARPSGEIIQFAELVRVQIRQKSWSARFSHMGLYKLSHRPRQGGIAQLAGLSTGGAEAGLGISAGTPVAVVLAEVDRGRAI